MGQAMARAAARLDAARRIMTELRLADHWGRFGQPCVVGAVAHELVVHPDIDMEIYMDQVRIADGFWVLEAWARHPRVTHCRFANHLDGPDQGLYWQVRFRDEQDVEWKVDMWSVAHDHPGPWGRALVAPLRRALTDETREAILLIKEALLDRHGEFPSLWIYRAVVEGGVRTTEEFLRWFAREYEPGLSSWVP
ncbi:MAG TPA: hypothetical protein VD902_01545 [Symbiobacteriaceae bacterium]|nr:hypothetical protein [Symbiobacteriaceae bacterium]